MTPQDYEQKKRECWENFKFARRPLNTDKKVFDYIFDRAYALGKEKEDATTQQDYKSSELECWCDFCNTEIARKNSFDRALVKAANNFAFFRGYLFGKHNLTSDAEGEEMLTVPRSKVQEEYAILSKELSHRETDAEDYIAWNYAKMTFEELFGSKCLPDEKASISMPLSEPKPSETKFKEGDMVIYKRTGKKKIVLDIDKYGRYYVALPNMQSPMYIDESDLEPYTEPGTHSNCTEKSDTCQPVTDCHHIEENREMPNRDLCDKLIRRGFENHNRLHIAAMAMQGLLASPVDANMQSKSVDYIIKASFEYADALIKESNKETNKQPK